MRASRLPVESGTAFPRGVLATRVSARRTYDRDSRQFGNQEVDEESGLPVWAVDGYDLAAMMAPPIETKSGHTFREPAEVKVYVIAEEEPVIPANQVNGMTGVVQFPGLMVTPWQNDKKCEGLRFDEDGEKLRCGCQIKLSFRSYGMEPFQG